MPNRLPLICCICLALACGAETEREPTPVVTQAELRAIAVRGYAAATDEWALAELAQTRHEPAHAWLTEKGNALFDGDPERVQELIDSLYAAGARAVWFTGIEEVEGVSMSAALAVEMPSMEADRQALLAREASWWKAPQPNPDVGQRYLGFSFADAEEGEGDVNPAAPARPRP